MTDNVDNLLELFPEITPGFSAQAKLAAWMGLLAVAMDLYQSYQTSNTVKPITQPHLGLFQRILFTLIITAFAVFIADALAVQGYNIPAWVIVFLPFINQYIKEDLALLKNIF